MRGERVSCRLSQPQPPVPPHLVHPGEECQALLFYQETTAQILVRALNPLDYRKWRYKPAYWKVLKVLKVGGETWNWAPSRMTVATQSRLAQ